MPGGRPRGSKNKGSSGGALRVIQDQLRAYAPPGPPVKTRTPRPPSPVHHEPMGREMRLRHARLILAGLIATAKEPAEMADLRAIDALINFRNVPAGLPAFRPRGGGD